MTMPTSLSALMACEYPPTTPVVPFTAVEGWGRECYDAGRDAPATPYWTPFMPHQAKALRDVPYWLAIRGQPCARRGSFYQHNGYWWVETDKGLELTTSDMVTHIMPAQLPGLPA